MNSLTLSVVMAGLVPAIHDLAGSFGVHANARDRSGHDGGGVAVGELVTTWEVKR